MFHFPIMARTNSSKQIFPSWSKSISAMSFIISSFLMFKSRLFKAVLKYRIVWWITFIVWNFRDENGLAYFSSSNDIKPSSFLSNNRNASSKSSSVWFSWKNNENRFEFFFRNDKSLIFTSQRLAIMRRNSSKSTVPSPSLSTKPSRARTSSSLGSLP